ACGFAEYSAGAITQMAGRAGHGGTENKQGSGNINSIDQGVLESYLIPRIVEHLNAEVVLGTINSVESALQWIRTSFFFVRLPRNPLRYGASAQLTTNSAMDFAKSLCLTHLGRLLKEGFIVIEQDKNNVNTDQVGEQKQSSQQLNESSLIRSTAHGAAMSKYYICFETMCLFSSITPFADLKEMLEITARAKEFEEFHIRMGEKKKLNLLNKEKQIRFPIKGKIRLPENKISLLVQAALGHVAMDDWQMKQESTSVLLNLQRILSCLADFALETKQFYAARTALILQRSAQQRMWENVEQTNQQVKINQQKGLEIRENENDSNEGNANNQDSNSQCLVLEQIEGIGPVFSSLLASRAGITSLDALANADPSLIEAVLHRNSPFGATLIRRAASVPRFDLSVSQRVTDDPNIVVVTVAVHRKNIQQFNQQQQQQQQYQSHQQNQIKDQPTQVDSCNIRLFVGNSKNEIIFSHRFNSRYVGGNGIFIHCGAHAKIIVREYRFVE
ncbi:MAG: putative Sec63 domain protein, partial [Streblomastix strix]